MSTVRSGYRLQASQCQDAMKVVYYVERDLAQFHPTKGGSHPCKPVCSQHVSVHRICLLKKRKAEFETSWVSEKLPVVS